MRQPAVFEFDPAAFDADFFVDYEQQLADINIGEQAAAALDGILTVRREDGPEKTYEQIRDESRAFFANEWVQRDEALVNQLAAQFALACMGHMHGSELARDPELGSVFEQGAENLGYEKHGHNRGHAEAKDKKKKNKKKPRKGWLTWFIKD